ncbi:MAG TPA: cbb3-type cytochrome c oxidase N-terminal domain-containing protein [bacterium]|nr:cbb3-type cytochrome c oxidase N-terminal domain-containing protein [bacterium]
MAQERDELLDHEYDGIREYDNPLPRWWLWLFYGTILFSIVYIPYYLLGFGPSEAQMYQQEMAEARTEFPQQAAMAPAAAAPGAQPGAAPAAPSIADPSMQGNMQAIAAGKEIFLANCKPCHGEHGQGIIGPNLTDNYWLHGNTFPEIVHTIYNGVPEKGMISWKSTLNPQKINEVAAYVMSIHGANPPNPKPPQGKEYTY